MRSLARENVFKFIYSRLFNQKDEGLFDVLNKELNDEDKTFAKDLLKAIDANYNIYLSEIENLAIGFKLNRILNVDKCALLVGIAEYNTFKSTPIPVIIDEAVKLSAKYSTEKSTDFVNGILGEYVKKYGRNN